jgi:phage gp36-like protein
MAYAFLTSNDVLSRIRDEHRNDLTDATEAVEMSAESMAIAKIKSALNGRYDVAGIFAAASAPTDQRSPLIVLHTLNLFVYLLYRRINPRKIPDEVKLDHEETLAWMDKVARGKESPDLPPVVDPQVSTNAPRFGGGQVRNGHYY